MSNIITSRIASMIRGNKNSKKAKNSRGNLKKVIPLLIIVLSALTMVNIHKGHLYSVWDSPVPPLKPELLVEKAGYTWDWWFVGGRSYGHAFYLLYFLQVWLLNFISPLGFANTIVYYVLFAFSGLSMYLFTQDTFGGSEKNNIKIVAALIAALAYMFNTYWIFRVSIGFSISYILAFLPLLLLVLRRALYSLTTLDKIKYLLASALVTVAMSPGYSGLPAMVFTFLLVTEYVFFLAILTRKLKSFVFTLVLFGLFTFCANLWWIAPQFFNSQLGDVVVRSSGYVEESLGVAKYWVPYSTPLNALRGIVYDLPSLYSTMPWTTLYETPLFLLLSIFPPIISALYLTSKRARKHSDTIVFLLMWITVLPILVGLNPPTGTIFSWMYEHIPFFIFRRPPNFLFGLHLIYSYLFGLGIVTIYSFSQNLTSRTKESLADLNRKRFVIFRLRSGIKKIVKVSIPVTLILIVVSVIFILPFPLWLGKGYEIELMGQRVTGTVEIPDYVQNLTEHLNAQPDEYGVLVLPMGSNLRAYSWDNGYFGWSPYYIMLDRPVLSFQPPSHPMNGLYTYLAAFEFYLDYELDPIGYDPKVICDDDETFWELNKGGEGTIDATLTEETSTVKNGTNSLKIAITSGSYSEVYIDHSYDEPQNLSSYDFIGWWWYGQDTGSIIRLQLRSNNNWDYRNQYEFVDDFSGWKKFMIPRLGFQQAGPNPVDWSATDYIRFQVIPNRNTDFYLDLVVLDFGQQPRFAEMLSLVGIKYIILAKDALPIPGQPVLFDSQVYQDFLSKQENIRFVGSFGSHLLYETFEDPRTFYTSTSVITSNVSDNSALSHLKRLIDSADPSEVAITPNLTIDSQSPPEILIEKISPVTYEIHVLNASSPFILVSPFIYEKNWVAKVDASESSPITVNGMFSGWLIDKTGNYVVNLHYIQQDFVDIVTALSLITILVQMFIISLSLTQRGKRLLLFSNKLPIGVDIRYRAERLKVFVCNRLLKPTINLLKSEIHRAVLGIKKLFNRISVSHATAFCLSIIFLASLTMIKKLGWNFVALWDSIQTPLNPTLSANMDVSLWDYQTLGGRNFASPTHFIYHVTVSAFSLVFPVNVANTVLFWLLFLMCGVSMYFFVMKTLNMEKAKKSLVALIASLVYMFNPYWVFQLDTQFLTLFILAFLPLLLLVSREALLSFNESKRKTLGYSVLASLVTVMMTPGIGMFEEGLVTAFFLGVYLMLLAVFKRKLRALIPTLILIGGFSLLFHLWWVTPNLTHSTVTSAVNRSSDYMSYIIGGLSNRSPYMTYSNVLRGMGYYIHSDPYIKPPNLEIYNSSLFIGISILTPLVASISLLSKRTVRKSESIVFAIIAAIFIPLFLTGLNAPFGPIIYWLSENVPFYIFARSSSFMFILQFAYAYMFGLGIFAAYYYMKKFHITKRVAYSVTMLILLLVIVVLPFPQWLGQTTQTYLVDNEANRRPTSVLVEVPSYVKNLSGYLNDSPKKGGVLVLPKALSMRGYDWDNGYFGYDVYYLSLERPVLSHALGGTTQDTVYDLIDSYIDSEIEQSDTDFSKLLTLLGISYIVVAEDALGWDGVFRFNFTQIHSYLSKCKDIELVGRFGRHVLYETTSEPETFYPLLGGLVLSESVSPESALKGLLRFNDLTQIAFIDHSDASNLSEIMEPISVYLDIDRQETGAVVEIFDENVTFWELSLSGTGNYDISLSQDTTEKMRGLSSLKMEITAGSREIVGVSHDYASPQDWSEKELLCLYVYGTNTGLQVRISVAAPDSDNWFRFNMTDNFSGWKLVGIPLGIFESAFGSPSWSAVKRIQIHFLSVNQTFTSYLDRTVVDVIDDPYLYEVNPVQMVAKQTSSSSFYVHMRDVEKPLILISNFFYHNDWVAEIDGTQLEHLEVDGLFNGWFINKTGNFNVKLYFQPQQQFESLKNISFLCIPIAFFGLLLCSLKKISNQIRLITKRTNVWRQKIK